MVFSQKLQALRKERGCSQEEVAKSCGVSRQAISKWEQGMIYPDIENLIRVGELFGVSLDYLIKEVNEDYKACGKEQNAFGKVALYEGVIIKESLSNELILDFTRIKKVEIWKTEDIPKYWTAIYFESDVRDFPYKLSNVLTGNWFVDMKLENIKIIVFKDKVLTYEIGNQEEKSFVVAYCKEMGIPEEQMKWSE